MTISSKGMASWGLPEGEEEEEGEEPGEGEEKEGLGMEEGAADTVLLPVLPSCLLERVEARLLGEEEEAAGKL